MLHCLQLLLGDQIATIDGVPVTGESEEKANALLIGPKGSNCMIG